MEPPPRSTPSRKILDLLARFESRNVTFVESDGSWPIVWKRARGVHVWDCDGRRYIDLTAAFGVAACGHANPRIVQAGRKQMGQLLHAMGDVHPHPGKAELAEQLSRLTFGRWFSDRDAKSSSRDGKVIFCNSGFEAVEAALKTAFLYTGRPGLIAFTGAYHGLGYGALTVTHRSLFRAPFSPQLKRLATFLPFPVLGKDLQPLELQLRAALAERPIGAIVAEPLQGRAGICVPPKGFLPLLRRVCNESGALLILDEIYTGFGRTGRWFACEHTRTAPDLICLGKALTGGFPLSACVGKASVMDAWPPSAGEALHTSTFLGHPVGCAMALAQIRELKEAKLIPHADKLGAKAQACWKSLPPIPHFHVACRGQGLLLGLELRDALGRPAPSLALATVKSLLDQGYILLPEGETGHILSLSPPLIIQEKQLLAALRAIHRTLQLQSVGAKTAQRNLP